MSTRSLHGWLKHWDFILLDIFCLQACYILCFRILYGSWNPYAREQYLFHATVFAFSQALVILFTDNYHGILRRKRFDEMLAVFRIIGYTLIIAIGFLFILHRSAEISRLQTGGTALLFLVIDYFLRQFNKNRVMAMQADDRKKKQLALFTSADLIPDAMERLYTSDVWRDFTVARIIVIGDESVSFSEYQGKPVSVLNNDTLSDLIHDWIDEIFVLQPDSILYPADMVNSFIDAGITVNYTLDSFSRGHWQNREIRKLGSYSVRTSSVHFITPGQLFVKRFTDIIGGLFGCIITAFLFLILGPLIKKADPGPIFFGQTRVGQNGRKFKVWKFRSMYMDAEKRKTEFYAQNRVKDGMMFKLDDDPRILGSEKRKKNGEPGGIGNFIRNTSLDEFPQFYNVLRGEMSLVGWRPCTLDEWEKYELRHRIRASMKPGITGMWQVSGRSEITDFDEVVRLDREYIENWSLALDLKILLKTVVAVINRKGAK